MVKSVRCNGFALRSMVMKVTFILTTLLILEQAAGKKRVVIHVPNKINNIHHHHVKKVIVYKPVPVKCHHQEGNKHDWTGQEAWDESETQKDEWVDKRPIIAPAASLINTASPSLPPWPNREIIKGGYMSGERISLPPSDSWDASTIKHLKTPLTTADVEEEEEEENMRRPALSLGLNRRPSPSSATGYNPGYKQSWISNDVIRVTELPPLIRASPVRGKKPEDNSIKTQQTIVAKRPKEHYVTYKVVKKKVTKLRARKKPTASPPPPPPSPPSAPEESWDNDEYKQYAQNHGAWEGQPSEFKIKDSSRPKNNIQPSYGTEIIKSNSYYLPAVPSVSTYDQDLYASSSSIKPQWSQDYYSNSNGVVSSKPYYDTYLTSSIRPRPQDAFVQSSGGGGNLMYDQYYNTDSYSSGNSYNSGTLYNNAGVSYTTGAGSVVAGTGGGSGVIKSHQDPFSFNSHKVKALLDQNVQTAIKPRKQRPTYDLNVHGQNKVKSDPSSYQMRYLHLNSSTPTAFLINHRSMNLSNSEPTRKGQV